MVSYPARTIQTTMDSITSTFLNDILKATATSDEVSYYQNVILAELAAAFKRHDDFKAKIIGRLSVPKNQPTIKEAFVKCERDAVIKKLEDQDFVIKKFMNCMVDTMDLVEKKLTNHDAVVKDCVQLNKQASEYFMKIKLVDDVPKVVEFKSPLESAHQKARDMMINVRDTPNISFAVVKRAKPITVEKKQEEETNSAVTKVFDQTVEVEETTEEVEETAEETTEEVEDTAEETTEEVEETVEETTEEVEETVEETTEEGEETVEETTEEVANEVPDGEETAEDETTEEVEEVEEVEETAEEAPDGDEATAEEDVSEEEIETEEAADEEEVEEYTHKGKKYYVTNTTNGKIYACTADDDIGDQVGSFKNGKPIFS